MPQKQENIRRNIRLLYSKVPSIHTLNLDAVVHSKVRLDPNTLISGYSVFNLKINFSCSNALVHFSC